MTSELYQDTISWLFQQFPSYQNIGAGAYKPDLGNINVLLDTLDISLSQVAYVHVAGTNGKGSTCSIIASTLKEAEYNVGLFTSPHIKDFRERIRVNGQEIRHEQVIAFVERVRRLKMDIAPSFFEISLAMALDHFNNSNCDIAIIETGLGGRLDATNCITPILSVITNIGLEHQKFLGETRDKIAFEKAGIIKDKIPVVIGQNDHEIMPVFQSKADECRSEIILGVSKDNNYFKKNTFLAKTALSQLKAMGFRSSDIDFEQGLSNLEKNTGLRARFQTISDNPKVILDAAHNADGIEALLNTIKTDLNFENLHIVYGSSNDKDLNEIGLILPKTANYYLTSFQNQRSLSSAELVQFAENIDVNASFYDSPMDALAHARQNAESNDLILVFGSFFLLEEIF